MRRYHTPTCVTLPIAVSFCYNSLTMAKIETITRMLAIPGRKWWLIIVVFLLVAWLLNTPNGLLGKADALGYAVCHRIDARSFHIHDRQTPLCSRCTGMYLGAMLGLTVQTADFSAESRHARNALLVRFGTAHRCFWHRWSEFISSILPKCPKAL